MENAEKFLNYLLRVDISKISFEYNHYGTPNKKLSMLLVVVALCFAVKVGIDLYTHHGEKIVVPDIRHKNFSDAEHLLVACDLKVVVSDTGYVKNLPPDCILEQTPEAGRVVKGGRVVYVVL